MNTFSIMAAGLTLLVVGLGACFSWQLLRQNGRLLLRLEELEERLDKLQSGEQKGLQAPLADESKIRDQKSKTDQSLVTSAATGEDARATRFSNRSLARSKLKRDGLKAGTPAPEFRLPRLDGGELSLTELRERAVLLVFSDPHCGPCNTLAPKLETFHREHPELQVVMISRGDLEENRAKVRQHDLTFPVVLQQQWEVSRLYAMFATPVAYLIGATGHTAADIALGVDAILELMAETGRLLRRQQEAPDIRFKDYLLQNVYLRTTRAERSEIIRLWHEEEAINDPAEAKQRAAEAVFLVRTASGELAGLSTVGLVRARDGRTFYAYQMFLRKQDRVSYLMLAVVLATRDFLSTFRHPTSQPAGMVHVNENTKLMRPGLRKLFERHGYSYWGVTAEGEDVWAVEFGSQAKSLARAAKVARSAEDIPALWGCPQGSPLPIHSY
jgi:peroxiredoxin